MNIKNILELYALYNEQGNLEELVNYKPLFMTLVKEKSNGKFKARNAATKGELEAAVKMALDYYEGSITGGVIVSDAVYQALMDGLVARGGKVISTTSSDNKVWPLVKHEAPFMVGTVKKCYEKEDFINYVCAMMHKYRKELIFTITPKFDGISSSVDVECEPDENGNITVADAVKLALTRKDGIAGQNITPVIKASCNMTEVIKHVANVLGGTENVNGWIKTELCISTPSFNAMKDEGIVYANRRSATSGTMNTPSNLMNARFISVIPLQFVSRDKSEVTCVNPFVQFTEVGESPESIFNKVIKLLNKIRMPEFPFRVDGVVIQPYALGSLDNKIEPNTTDLLDDSIAFKINMQVGLTKALYIYPSVGRFGTVTPMLKVEPTDVNETEVEDVSLSNIKKTINLGIHKNEIIEVYSAGDVIPMARIPEERNYPENEDLLTMSMECPYCHEHFVIQGENCACVNPECPRVISGRIMNFLDKLGVKDISDATVEELHNLGFINSINDLFTLDYDEFARKLVEIPGWGPASVNNLVNELERVLKSEITISKLIGSLGIQGIGKRKCKTIINGTFFDFSKVYDSEDALEDALKEYFNRIIEIKGVKGKTATKYINFIFRNYENIQFIASRMKIVPEKESKGSIVFTGFRDLSLAEEIDNSDFDYSESINGDTKILVTSGPVDIDEIQNAIATKKKSEWRKQEKAYAKGIQILSKSDFLKLIENGLLSSGN